MGGNTERESVSLSFDDINLTSDDVNAKPAIKTAQEENFGCLSSS